MAQIDIQNASLDYLDSTIRSIRRALLTLFTNNHTKIKYRALDNVNLKISEGDFVGLIGRNGAGKSTLLRLINSIYFPCEGSVTVCGKVASMLNLTIGIDMDMTGYENCILLGMLHGQSKKQMLAKYNDIKSFTELGDYLNKPLRVYSTGMLMRLAFSVITSIETDIFLLDETIGVGDSKFLNKAHDRLLSVAAKCKILVIASHSKDIIRTFCNKVIVMDQGRCLFFGDLEAGFDVYERLLGTI